MIISKSCSDFSRSMALGEALPPMEIHVAFGFEFSQSLFQLKE